MKKLKLIAKRIIWILQFIRVAIIGHKRYKFKNHVSIDITSRCNLRCLNCQASCRQAPSNECISVEQVDKFINDAIRLGYRWKCLDLYGGEPTLHPQLDKIIKVIEKYAIFNPSCTINIISNGTGDFVIKKLSELPRWITRPKWNRDKSLDFENKIERQDFHTYNVAPIDLPKYKSADFSKGCWRLAVCHGLTLSRYGFYPCTAGASVDRIFGFNIGIKKLSDVNEESKRNQLKVLCKYCGFFREPNITIEGKEEISLTWKKAYGQYKKQKPKLTLY